MPMSIAIGLGLTAGGAPLSLPLDGLTSAAAYSVRKLRSAFTGSALRVRRSSDNAEQDIGFLGAAVDTVAMLTFCGAGNGFVSKWYDQSGNGNDLVQATAANQPRIVSSGSVLTLSARPTLTFDATDYFSAPDAASLQLNAAMTVHSVVSVPDVTTYRFIAAKLDSNGAAFSSYEFRISSAGTVEFLNCTGTGTNTVASTTGATASVKMGLAATRTAGGAITHYRDGSAAGTGTTAAVVGSTHPLYVGTREDTFTLFNGSISEVVLLSSSLSASQVAAMYGSF